MLIYKAEEFLSEKQFFNWFYPKNQIQYLYCSWMFKCTPATTDIIADNIFVGTWVHQKQDDIIIFYGNSFIKQWDSGSIRGSFVYDDKNITFVSDSGKIWKTPYQMNTKFEVKWAKYEFERSRFFYGRSNRYADFGHHTFINNNLILKDTRIE